jgi:hypothetical protein
MLERQQLRDAMHLAKGSKQNRRAIDEEHWRLLRAAIEMYAGHDEGKA